MPLPNNVDIKIRPYTMEDVVERFEAVRQSEDHLLPWIPWAKNYTLEKSQDWVEQALEAWGKEKDYCFVILDKNNHYIGEVKLLNVNRHYYESKASAAYWIRGSNIRRGAASTALKLIAEFAFNELKLHRVEIMILPENTKSLGVAKKVGAKKEGMLRNQWLFDGSLQDVILFSIIPSDLI